MTKGKQVYAWNDGDIERTKATYSHQGSVKHWCVVKGKLHAFDNVSDPPPEQISILKAQKLISEYTGKTVVIIP